MVAIRKIFPDQAQAIALSQLTDRLLLLLAGRALEIRKDHERHVGIGVTEARVEIAQDGTAQHVVQIRNLGDIRILRCRIFFEEELPILLLIGLCSREKRLIPLQTAHSESEREEQEDRQDAKRGRYEETDRQFWFFLEYPHNHSIQKAESTFQAPFSLTKETRMLWL